MVLKLLGYRRSSNTKRVVMMLREKKVPFEYTEVDLVSGEQRSPENLAKNPFGTVPIIDDDGFILSESRAIVRYIENKYSNQEPKLIPTGLKENALFEQAAHRELCSFYPYVSGALLEKYYKRFFKQECNEENYKESMTKLVKTLKVYDEILSKQKYLAGDEFTLADLFHASVAADLPFIDANVMTDPERPNVARWWNDITSRESWIAVKDGVFETNSPKSGAGSCC